MKQIREGMRVELMIIGAQKCGTTSLARQLAAHPEICFCEVKEPGYFNTVRDWESGLAAYHGLYSPRDGQICGEASTMYTFLPEWHGTHSRLFAYNPDLKLIYIMRDPIDRVISNYSHRLVRGTVKDSPEVAIASDPTYINRSRYGVQIKPYVELFGERNILFLIFEEFFSDQSKALKRIAKFLDIDPNGFDDLGSLLAAQHQSVGQRHLPSPLRKVVHQAGWVRLSSYVPKSMRYLARRVFGKKLERKPDLTPEFRETLWRLLEADVSEIEALLGRGLHPWRSKHT